LPFEVPYWAGEYPVNDEEEEDVEVAEEDAYPLPFHPLELGEEALNAFFGFRLEGIPTAIEPFEIPLAGFRAARQRSLVDRLRGRMSGRGS
jgi:hypothetical protein